MPPVCSGQCVSMLAADIPQLAVATCVGAETPLPVSLNISLSLVFFFLPLRACHSSLQQQAPGNDLNCRCKPGESQALVWQTPEPSGRESAWLCWCLWLLTSPPQVFKVCQFYEMYFATFLVMDFFLA